MLLETELSKHLESTADNSHMTEYEPPSLAEAQPDPKSFGLWGPANQVQPKTERTPKLKAVDSSRKNRSGWGLGDVAWAGFALVLSQVILVAALAVWAVVSISKPSVIDEEYLNNILAEIVRNVKTGPGIGAALVSQWAVFVGIPYLAAKRKGLGSLAADFGLRFKISDIWYGLGVAVSMQAVLLGISQTIKALGIDVSGADNTRMVTDHTGVFLIGMALAAAIGAPITEEIFFRGLILRSFMRRFAKVDLAAPKGEDTQGTPTRAWVGTVLSVLITSAIFGAAHAPVSDGTTVVTTAAVVALAGQTGLLGAVFAVIAIKTRRIGTTICAHIAFNTISIGLVLILR